MNLSSVAEWAATPEGEDVLLLEDALCRLEQADPRAARVVELRYFGGLLEAEVAEVIGVSVITVKRDWKIARAWLIDQLRPRQDSIRFPPLFACHHRPVIRARPVLRS